MRSSSPTPAARAGAAVRSLRDDRVPDAQLAVRRSETVRDGLEVEAVTEPLTAENAILDPVTGKYLELSARQMTAINLLTMGKSVVATAQSLDIGVSTLHRWKSKHPAFVAELNRRKHELFERTIDKLRSTMAKAVDELHALMSSKNPRERYEIAMKLLPLMQPRKWIEPTGPTDAQGVVEARVREKRLERGEEVNAEVTDGEREAVIAEVEERMPGHPEERSDEGPRIADDAKPSAATRNVTGSPAGVAAPNATSNAPSIASRGASSPVPPPPPAILRRCAPLDDRGVKSGRPLPSAAAHAARLPHNDALHEDLLTAIPHGSPPPASAHGPAETNP